MECTIRLIWDSESCKWYTDSSEKLSLNLESDSFDALIERVRLAVPEMLELNYGYNGQVYIKFEVSRIDELEMVS